MSVRVTWFAEVLRDLGRESTAAAVRYGFVVCFLLACIGVEALVNSHGADIVPPKPALDG